MTDPTTQDLLARLRDDGADTPQAAADALCDGAYLASIGITDADTPLVEALHADLLASMETPTDG